MNEKFVMRRANGDVFTEEVDGKIRVPVWSSEQALARYKERNPELMIFLSTHLTRSLIDRVRSRLDKAHSPEFFLLTEDAPEADLYDGRPITLEEIFPGSERFPHAAQPQS